MNERHEIEFPGGRIYVTTEAGKVVLAGQVEGRNVVWLELPSDAAGKLGRVLVDVTGGAQ